MGELLVNYLVNYGLVIDSQLIINCLGIVGELLSVDGFLVFGLWMNSQFIYEYCWGFPSFWTASEL
jgi:hypothetical protein